MPNYSYQDVLDRWDTARAFGEQRSLPEYAQHLNDTYGTNDFDAGKRDGLWTRASTRADEFLHNTVGQVTGPIGEGIGDIFGAGEAGRRVGEDLPRNLMEMAPLALGAAGIPITAGLMGAHTYAQTGSGTAAAISGAAGLALPFAGELGGSIGSNIFARSLGEAGGSRLGHVLGSQVAQFGTNEASMYAMHRTLSPNEPFDPLSADFLLQQIPWTVRDVYKGLTGPVPGRKTEVAPVEKALPQEYVPPSSDDQKATLSEAMENFQQVLQNPESKPEDRAAAMQALLKTNLQPKAVEDVKSAVTQQAPPVSSMGGELQAPESPELQGQPLDLSPQEQGSMVEMGADPQRVLQLVDTQQKSNNLALDAFQGPIQKDAEGNVVRLGNTDVAKDGWMDEVRFQKATQLPEGFVEAMRQQYPEAFQQGRVNTTELVKGLQERPMMEVKELGEGTRNPKAVRYSQLQHELDTIKDVTPNEDGSGFTAKALATDGVKAKVQEFNALMQDPEAQDDFNDQSKYSFLSSKSEMPGYVESLVRVPQETRPKEKYGGVLDETQGGRTPTPFFSGPHFGAEDTNVLAFSRGFEDSGTSVKGNVPGLAPEDKVWHNIEDQSDWAQRVREEQEGKILGGFDQNAPGGIDTKKTSAHPLLPYYETFALKSQIQHALKVGAKWFFLPDWETAGMTQGHDKHVVPDVVKTTKEYDDAEVWVNQQANPKDFNIGRNFEGSGYEIRDVNKVGEPSQSAGMRLHYDRTLPETLAKLTGDQGVEVGMGVHKQATIQDGRETAAPALGGGGRTAGELQGSPVFRDSTGAPKTQITGRLFSLANISGGLSENDTLSLKESVAKYQEAKTKETAARISTQTPLTDAKQIAQLFGADASSVEPKISSRISDGASTAQAVVHEVMRKLGMDVHEAVVEQEVQKAEVHRVVNLGAHGQEPTKYGGALKDEQGNRRVWSSESQALKYLEQYKAEHPEDKQQYETRNAGGGIASPNFRGIYLAPKENVVQSIDKPTTTGTSIHEVLQDYSHEQAEALHETAADDLTERPQASLDVYLRNLDVASRSPLIFQREGDFEDAPSALRAIRQARIVLSGNTDKTLAEVNSALEAAGVQKFGGAAEYSGTMTKVRDGLDAFGRSPTLQTLGSQVPFDQKIVDAVGLSRGPKAVISWIAQQKFGLMSDFANALAKHPQILDQAQFILPGQDGHFAGQTFYEPSLGGGNINLDYLPDASSLSKWVSDVMHETLHHFESTLSSRNDPAAEVYKQTRTQILKTLAESPQLPKKIRDYLKVTLDRQDYSRWAADEKYAYADQWKKDLGAADYNKYNGILYGLQNETEMVAQLFSDKDMQALAFATKVPKTSGLWDSVVHWFSAAFAKLSGVPNNALTEILKGFDNYLTGGVLKKTYNAGDFIRDSLLSKYGVRPEALASRMQSIENMFSAGGLRSSIVGFTREMENGLLHPDQAQGPLVQTLRTSLIAGEARDVFHSTMDLLAEEVPVHQELWYRMKQDLQLTKEIMVKVQNGELPGRLPEGLSKSLQKSAQKVNAMKQALMKQGIALDRWNSLDQFEVSGYENGIISSVTGKRFPAPAGETGDEEQGRAAMGLAPEREVWRVKRETSREAMEQSPLAKVGGAIRRAFMLTQFMKQQVPAFRTVADGVSQNQGETNLRAYTLNIGYGYDPASQTASNKTWNENVRVANDERLTKAASDVKQWINVQEAEGVDWKMDDSFPKGVLDKLGKKDRDAIVGEINSNRARNKVLTDQVMPKYLSDLNREKTAFIVNAREPGMPATKAREFAASLYDALALVQDPMSAMTGAEQLRLLSSQVQPQTYLSALKFAQEQVQASQKTLSIMQSRPNYTSEQRQGQYHLRMTGPNGETHYSDSSSQQQLADRTKALEAKGYTFNYSVDKADANVPTGDTDSFVFGAMQDMDAQAAARVQSYISDLPPERQSQILDEMQRANDFRASLAAAKPVPGAGPTRKFVAGREYINSIKNQHEFIIRLNNYMRHTLTRAQTSVDMLDPEIQGNTEVRKYSQDHVDNFLSPDNPIVRKFNEYTYYTKLAWNFGVNFLHGIQSLTTGMASVIAESGGVGDAFKLTADAQKAFIGRLTKGKWANDEHDWLYKQAMSRGDITGLGSWEQLRDFDLESVQNMNRGMNPVTQGADYLAQGARKWTGMFLKFNDAVGLLAGYDLARSRGLTQDEAYSQAVDLKNRGYYTGGKAQRAVGLWSIKTKAVPQLLSSLQTYTFGWFSQLSNNYINGFGAALKDLTPAQRVGAKKAFLYQLGAQAVLAGALGLPGVGQGMALVKQATGVDTKGWVQQNLGKLFGSDEETGGMLGTLATHGMLATFSPIDPSMRHMPSFPFTGVSPYKGFDISQLAPAPVSAAGDLVQGLLAAARGDTNTTAQKILPHVLQGPYKLWQGEGDIRDKRGGLLYQLSPMEKFVTALGMEPSRVAHARDTADAVKALQAKQEALLGSLADDIAETQRDKGVDASRARLREVVQQNPGVDPVKLATAAVSRLVAQSVPLQPQRLVNPGLDLQGLDIQSSPQESQRAQVQSEGRSAFGLPWRNNLSREESAGQTDAVLQQNPFLPVSAARKVASGKMQVPRPYSGLEFLENQ